jgi:anti-sigma factor RsiW
VLSCSDCLARHSEYLDGLMDSATAEEWRLHLAECEECARYDRVVRRGLKILAAQGHIEPDADFTSRLHQRIAVEDRRAQMRPMTSLAGASVAVAAMLAFAAWVPVIMLANEESQNTVAMEAAPMTTATSEIAWHAEDAVEHATPTHIHLATRRIAWAPSIEERHVIEPQYTPVVLESPIAPPNYSRAYYSAD